MKDNFYMIQNLLNQKADYQSRLSLIPYDGSIEIKTIGNEKYIYLRKRVSGRYTSKYIDKYSDELYLFIRNQISEVRVLRKNIRKIEKELALLGYSEKELTSDILLNIDFARINVKTLIYDQAVLEGVTTTFPQTETILENGKVNGVSVNDIQKILNLKHAWEFILDKDVLMSNSNYYVLQYIARLVNEGFYDNGGRIRCVPVTIGGCKYVPQIPIENVVKERIENIINGNDSYVDKAIEIALYCMKTQIFNDGNKRAAIIFANHYLISHGGGILVVPEEKVSEFKKKLIKYYEGEDESLIRSFLKENCLRNFK